MLTYEALNEIHKTDTCNMQMDIFGTSFASDWWQVIIQTPEIYLSAKNI